MAEPQTITFEYKEVVDALIKRQDIHEGIWQLYIEFGITAANIGQGPTKENVIPAAIVPLLKIGIHKVTEENQLTVNAAVANPPPKPRSTPTKRG